MKFLNYLAVFIIFSGALKIETGTFDLYLYYIIIAITLPILFFKANLKLPYPFLLFMLFLLVIGVVNILLGHNLALLLSKQVFGILLVSLFFYFILRINNFNYLNIWTIYLRFAFWVGFIGIFQFIMFQVNIKPLYDFSWFLPEWRLEATRNFVRVNSILPEPSHFCISMMPSFFAAIYKLTGKTSLIDLSKFRSIVIVISVLLSSSILGYVGVCLSLVLVFLNKIRFKHILIAFFFSLLLFTTLYFSFDGIRSRIDGLYETFILGRVNNSTNLSSWTIYNNYRVTKENLHRHPFFGTGLGSHQIAFDKYGIKDIYDLDYLNNLNREDANSLLLRILSETGIVGFLLAAIFLVNNYISKNSYQNKLYWLISNSILVVISVKLVREGHYFVNGFPLFLWMYYFNSKKAKINNSSD